MLRTRAIRKNVHSVTNADVLIGFVRIVDTVHVALAGGSYRRAVEVGRFASMTAAVRFLDRQRYPRATSKKAGTPGLPPTEPIDISRFLAR